MGYLSSLPGLLRTQANIQKPLARQKVGNLLAALDSLYLLLAPVLASLTSQVRQSRPAYLSVSIMLRQSCTRAACRAFVCTRLQLTGAVLGEACLAYDYLANPACLVVLAHLEQSGDCRQMRPKQRSQTRLVRRSAY